MTLKIFYQRSFERDLKRMKKRGKDLSKIKILTGLLAEQAVLPTKYRQHKLIGNYRNCWECHIEPDWLLVYKRTAEPPTR